MDINLDGIIMAGVWSLHKIGLLECGSSRGHTETFLLIYIYECHDDISSKNICLSRSNVMLSITLSAIAW